MPLAQVLLSPQPSDKDMTPMPRRRGPPTALRIDTPQQNPLIAIALDDNPTSALSSDSDYSFFNPPQKSRSHRNMKKLSLTLPSAQSSSNSLLLTSSLPPSEPQSAVSGIPEIQHMERPRRPSVISLPTSANYTANTLLHRKEEEGSPAVPYADGPTQILPGIWLGSEDNARDWKGLIERGIKSILNVAKEVASPFDHISDTRPLRSFASTPNLTKAKDVDPHYYPAHLASGRPGMHYLKLQWSHGQQNLVEEGFPMAMAFTDAALQRGEGVLIHCQCGISRSATMVIALVMRAAAESSPSVPPEIWQLKGMQGAYEYVKEKSKWVGPNMSLIYQLLEFERKLKGVTGSPTNSDRSSIIADEEEEWGRQRRMLDEAPSDPEEEERESTLVMREAQALDKAMEDRIVARKNSGGSMSSVSSAGVGMGPAWRSRYGSRKRTGSIASSNNGSIISEDLVEEDEEQELLGIGGGFDRRCRSPSVECESSATSASTNSPDDEEIEYQPQPPLMFTPSTARPNILARRPPPSAPAWKTSFATPRPPATAIRSTFDIPPPPISKPKGKRRPPPLGALPPVPSSPIAIIVAPPPESPVKAKDTPPRFTLQPPPQVPLRVRTESRKPAPPPLHLRNAPKTPAFNRPQTPRNHSRPSSIRSSSIVSTPSQTLFVFPPSPTLTTRTPSTMTLTSNLNSPLPFPSLATPRISTFRSQGRTRSYIGVGAPPTPTTACSRVDARGWVGLD